MSNSTRDMQRIVDQISSKLRDRERAESDLQRAQEKVKRNSGDSSAARDLERASEQIERIDNDIERLKGQL